MLERIIASGFWETKYNVASCRDDMTMMEARKMRKNQIYLLQCLCHRKGVVDGVSSLHQLWSNFLREIMASKLLYGLLEAPLALKMPNRFAILFAKRTQV